MASQSDSPTIKATPTKKRKPGQTMTPAERQQKQDAFLAAYGSLGILISACDLAGISRDTVYDWKKRYKSFSRAFDDAEARAASVIELELMRRAVEGVPEPAISGGRLVYEYEPTYEDDGVTPKRDRDHKIIYKRGAQVYITKYSDALMAILAKARIPGYKDKPGDINISSALPPVVTVKLQTMPPAMPEEPAAYDEPETEDDDNEL